MNNPIKTADLQLQEVVNLMNDRIRQLAVTGSFVERDAMVLYCSKLVAARQSLSSILKGLEHAERQGGQASAPVNQPGGIRLPLGVRGGKVDSNDGAVQSEDQGDQGKDG